MLYVVMMSIVMLSVIMLSVIMLSVFMLSVIMKIVIMLSVVMLNVVAPSFQTRKNNKFIQQQVGVCACIQKSTYELLTITNCVLLHERLVL